MSKSASKRQLTPTQVRAVARNLRISPRKLNLMAQMIRGKKAAEALRSLQYSPKRIADDVKKTLQSAIANAENNHNLDVDSLVVNEAYVGKGLLMKRFHTRARGRGVRIEKFFSHLTIIVESKTAEQLEQWGKKVKPQSVVKANHKSEQKPTPITQPDNQSNINKEMEQ